MGRVLTFLSSNREREVGYLLPVVIVLGLAVGVVNVVALQAVANNSTTLNDQFYDATAREAAEAGISAAYKCLNKGADTDWTLSVSAVPDLVNTDCGGGGDPIKVVSNDTFESTYSVKSPDRTTYPASGSNVRVIVTSVGIVKIKNSAGNSVKTIKKSIRALGELTVTPGPGTNTNVLAADKLSTGPSTACAIANDWVYCWGSNSGNMLGTGGWNYYNDRSTVPVAIADVAIAKQPSTPANKCDNNIFTAAPSCGGARAASAMSGLKVKKVSVGTDHVCAIAAATSTGSPGRVYCWGKNTTGQLGDLTEDDRDIPVAVYTGDAMTRSCTHRNIFGVCDRWDIARDVGASALRNSDGSLKDVTDISSGDGFTCALTSDNEVSCWGANNHGQLANDTRNDSAIPVAVSKSSTTQTPTCVDWEYGITYIFNPNDKWCATNGYNPANSTVPSALIGKQVKKLAKMRGGGATMCVITAQDKAVCWGENYGGQAGGTAVPSTMSGSGTVRSGNPNDCPRIGPQARDEARDNANLNRVRYFDALRPVEIQTSMTFSDISVASNGSLEDFGSSSDSIYSYVIAKSSTASSMDRLFYWGSKTTDSSTSSCIRNSDANYSDWSQATAKVKVSFSGQPTPVGPLYNTSAAGPLQGQPISLYSGNAVTDLFCAQAAASIYCDAHGAKAQQGQLGNGYTCSGSCSAQNGVKAVSTDRTKSWLTPEKNIVALDTGASGYTCAVADDGGIGCWGLNSSGQLGNGNTNNQSRPVAVAFPASNNPTGPTAGSTTTYEVIGYF